MKVDEAKYLILQHEIEIPQHEQDKFRQEPEIYPEGKRNPNTAELVFDTLKKIFERFEKKHPDLRSPW